MEISDEDIELIRRDLFRRYNCGMTALTRSEIARAKYLYDLLTQDLKQLFEEKEELYNKWIEILLPKTKRNLPDREKKNLLLVAIREVLILSYIPIIGEKEIKVGATTCDRYYEKFIITFNEQERKDKIEEIIKILNKIYEIREKLTESKNELKDNVLFYKSVYWMLAILYKVYPDNFYKFSTNQFIHYVEDGGEVYFNGYKNITTGHIENRYVYIKKYIDEVLKLDISKYIEDVRKNKKEFLNKNKVSLRGIESWDGIGKQHQLITINTKMKTTEIIDYIKQNRFIIRPEYQRTEVKDRQKASRIIESILLGIKLPPIYLYSKILPNGLATYVVLDRTAEIDKCFKIYGRKYNRWEVWLHRNI